MAPVQSAHADGWHICWLPPLDDGTLSLYFGMWCGGDCVLWTGPVVAPPASDQPRTELAAIAPIPAEVPNAHPQCLRHLLPESDVAWTSLRPVARWDVCVCGRKHAALPALLPSGPLQPTSAEAPLSHVAEPAAVLLDAMLAPLETALLPLVDARLGLADGLAILERLCAASPPNALLQQLQAQLQITARRLNELRPRLAPEPHAATDDGISGGPLAGETLLGRLCLLAASHCTPAAASSGAPAASDGTRGRQEVATELTAIRCAASAELVAEAMAVAHWCSLNQTAVYRHKGGPAAKEGSRGKLKGGGVGGKHALAEPVEIAAPSGAHKPPATADAHESSVPQADPTGLLLPPPPPPARAHATNLSSTTLEPKASAKGAKSGKGLAASHSARGSPSAPAAGPSSRGEGEGTGRGIGSGRGRGRGRGRGGGGRGGGGRGSGAEQAASPSRASKPAKRPKLGHGSVAPPTKAADLPLAERPRAPGKRPLPPENPRTRVMPASLRSLLSMGWPRADAESALRRVGGVDVQAAIELLTGDDD